MEKENINGATITPHMTKIIAELQDNEGTGHMYVRAIGRVERTVLMHTDEIGMTSWTAMNLLRTLAMLKEDIKALSIPGHGETEDDDDEDFSAADYRAVIEGENPYDPYFGHEPEDEDPEEEIPDYDKQA